MGRVESNPATWLPEMWLVIRAMATTLDGLEPSPKLLAELLPRYENCIGDHKVRIEWFPEGYSDDPKRSPEYAISLIGTRFKARWLILATDLHKALKGNILN